MGVRPYVEGTVEMVHREVGNTLELMVLEIWGGSFPPGRDKTPMHQSNRTLKTLWTSKSDGNR